MQVLMFSYNIFVWRQQCKEKTVQVSLLHLWSEHINKPHLKMSPTEPTKLQATGHRTAEFVEYNKPFYFIFYQLPKKLLFKKNSILIQFHVSLCVRMTCCYHWKKLQVLIISLNHRNLYTLSILPMTTAVLNIS